MITRDNKFSISGTAQTARQRLGEVIRFYREDRDITVRDVSRRCKVAAPLVEKWESGEQLPSTDEWKGLCRGVNRALNAFQELYTRARAEADTEVKEQKTVKSNPTTKINSALGDKLAGLTPGHFIVDDPAPPPPVLAVVRDTDAAPVDVKRDTTRLREALAKLPEGWKASEQVEKRKAFVLDLLRTRPGIRGSGRDSIDEALQRTFGVGLSASHVAELRAQVQREIAERDRERIRDEERAKLSAPTVAPGGPIAHQVAEAVKREALEVEQHASATRDHEADLNAAVSMILEAIPNLQTFTIAIDEHGEASIDYQIRKVKIETVGGSFKVKR